MYFLLLTTCPTQTLDINLDLPLISFSLWTEFLQISFQPRLLANTPMAVATGRRHLVFPRAQKHSLYNLLMICFGTPLSEKAVSTRTAKMT